ncbi:hypothetical protein F511_29585 [Dorcoceras hygrometricum]|uniref:Uncharacterized protein n=1 Tax=Dorcoceras hygrometricum TaxID=472368 RepID=A0A2Z7D7G0_9LAMI|nr:hypothetical protein F511_29585 [Dorcoceras hygrometricum]
MTNRRMEEPVARGMVLRLDEQLRVAILACGFEEPVEGATRRRMVKLKRCVSSIASGTSFEDSTSFCLVPCDWIACDWKVATGLLRLVVATGLSYCSPEAFFPRFPSFSVEDLSVFGGAGSLVGIVQILIGVFRVKSGREVLRIRMYLLEICFSFSAACFVVNLKIKSCRIPLSIESAVLLPTTGRIWNLMVTVACSWWKWKSSCCACVASGSRCARERMTNRRMEEPVARGMVLRLDKKLRGAILACGFEEPVEGATRRRMVKLKRCVSSIASGTSFEDSTSFCLVPCDWIACDWIACDWKVASGLLRLVVATGLSYCSPEAFFPRFPSFSVEDLSVFGGAGFLVNFSFDCYPFEAAERPGRRSR